MSNDLKSYSEQDLVDRARHHFAGPLIISSASFMLFGYNVSQLLRYYNAFWKGDRIWTRLWVVLVSIVNAVSVAYGGIYADYLVSISSWDSEASARDFALQSAVCGVLYAAVIFMVQSFWLTCIHRMTLNKPKFHWLIIAPIGLISMASFVVSLVLAAFLTHQSTYSVLAVQATLIQVSSALALGCDILILGIIIINLFKISKEARRLEKSISRLTSTFCFVTLISTLVLVAEIVVVSPTGSQTNYIIDFTYLYTPVYAFSMLSILNSRRVLQSTQLPFSEATRSMEQLRSQPENEIGFDISNLFEKSSRDGQAVGVSSGQNRSREDLESN